MSRKIIFIIHAALMLSGPSQRVSGQAQSTPPNPLTDETVPEEDPAITGISPIRYEEGDFDPPDPGMVRGREWQAVRYGAHQVKQRFQSDVDTIGGEPAKFRSAIKAWIEMLEQAIESRTLDDLIASTREGVRIHLEFAPLAQTDPQFWDQVAYLGSTMEGMTYSTILALVAHLEVSDGELSPANIERMLQIYAAPRLVGEPQAWEDGDPVPPTSSGMFVIDPIVAAEVLKAGDWKVAKTLVGSFEDADTFFWRYRGDLNGLPVLERKYAANRELIHAKFDEIKAWMEEQRRLAEPESADESTPVPHNNPNTAPGLPTPPSPPPVNQ